MKNNTLLVQKIDEGIKYIQEQSKKLDPVLSYFSNRILLEKDNLSTKEVFEYYLKLQELKVNSLLLLTKMKEIQDYEE